MVERQESGELKVVVTEEYSAAIIISQEALHIVSRVCFSGAGSARKMEQLRVSD